LSVQKEVEEFSPPSKDVLFVCEEGLVVKGQNRGYAGALWTIDGSQAFVEGFGVMHISSMLSLYVVLMY
jgi:hypothetical protein